MCSLPLWLNIRFFLVSLPAAGSRIREKKNIRQTECMKIAENVWLALIPNFQRGEWFDMLENMWPISFSLLGFGSWTVPNTVCWLSAYWATLTPREELFFLLTIYTSEVNCEEEEHEGMIGSINRGDGDWLQDHWQFPTKPFPTKGQKCILYCILYVCLFANFLMFLHSQDVICSHLFFCW